MKWFAVSILVCVCFEVLCALKISRHNQNRSAKLQLMKTNPPHFEIDIKIHIDHVLQKNLISQYGRNIKSKIQLIMRSLLQKTEGYFKHPSLKSNLKLNLIETRFLKNISISNENGSIYLRNYCEWQLPRKTGKHYYSILFTGLDVYLDKDGRKIQKSTGRGYRSGICAPHKSCTLIEWRPKNLAYLLAHEIGHSLGLTHDGPPLNLCPSSGFIMSATYDTKNHPKTWSACSRSTLNMYLQSKNFSCLRRNSTQIKL